MGSKTNDALAPLRRLVEDLDEPALIDAVEELADRVATAAMLKARREAVKIKPEAIDAPLRAFIDSVETEVAGLARKPGERPPSTPDIAEAQARVACEAVALYVGLREALHYGVDPNVDAIECMTERPAPPGVESVTILWEQVSCLTDPQRAALKSAGIITANDIKHWTRNQLVGQVHGIGPATANRLRDELGARGIEFKAR
jgi:hypothetical protein